jgi:hypothetical protein
MPADVQIGMGRSGHPVIDRVVVARQLPTSRPMGHGVRCPRHPERSAASATSPAPPGRPSRPISRDSLKLAYWAPAPGARLLHDRETPQRNQPRPPGRPSRPIPRDSLRLAQGPRLLGLACSTIGKHRSDPPQGCRTLPLEGSPLTRIRSVTQQFCVGRRGNRSSVPQRRCGGSSRS